MLPGRRVHPGNRNSEDSELASPGSRVDDGSQPVRQGDQVELENRAMKRLPEIRLPFDHSPEALDEAVNRLLEEPGTPWLVIKKSLDARSKGRIVMVYSIGIPEPGDEKMASPIQRRAPDARPVIIGAGPAGLFAAYRLALSGVPSLLIEQGDAMPERVKAMARFMRYGNLDLRSNLGFGAGGAGAYSDGKLMTRIRSPHIPFIMDSFIRFGGPEEIRYLANPHLGSGRIRRAIHRMIEYLEELGVEVRFRTQVKSFNISDAHINSVVLNNGTEIETSTVLLAAGHSARRLYVELAKLGVAMEFKDFAAGLRLEHPTQLINRIQFGSHSGHPALGAATYRLSHTWGKDESRRALFSFCMCPGGFVLNAATESDGVVCNGMSNTGRRGNFSNAAFVVNVTAGDIKGTDLLRGMKWQRDLEQKAAAAANPWGGAHALPAQRLVDFLNARDSEDLPKSSCPNPLQPARLDTLLPTFIVDAMHQGLEVFERRMRGLCDEQALLIGVESRTSAPVRILRNPDTRQSPTSEGLYPIGEGAGYAGGITSSAADGIAAADALLETLPEADRS